MALYAAVDWVTLSLPVLNSEATWDFLGPSIDFNCVFLDVGGSCFILTLALVQQSLHLAPFNLNSTIVNSRLMLFSWFKSLICGLALDAWVNLSLFRLKDFSFIYSKSGCRDFKLNILLKLFNTLSLNQVTITVNYSRLVNLLLSETTKLKSIDILQKASVAFVDKATWLERFPVNIFCILIPAK